MPDRVPYATAARSLLRDTVVGAVDDLVRTRGWAATTMADVARAAGVSRQTLYNEFGSRSALVEAYVTREIDSLVTEVDAAVRTHDDDAHKALRHAFELFLRLASDEPVVRIIVGGTSGADVDGELMTLLTGVGQALAVDRVASLIVDVWAQVAPDDARVLADSLVRLAISHALVPTLAVDVAAAGVSRMLAPFVDEILSAAPSEREL